MVELAIAAGRDGLNSLSVIGQRLVQCGLLVAKPHADAAEHVVRADGRVGACVMQHLTISLDGINGTRLLHDWQWLPSGPHGLMAVTQMG